jgi:hypothetical protein
MALFKEAAPSASITSRARRDRGTDELLGLCRGILADGGVNQSEAAFLLDWLERHREFLGTYPFDVLYRRVSDSLADGVLDLDEERDLLEALVRAVGGETHTADGSTSLATDLPFDEPFPALVYPGQLYVVTGVFDYGSRSLVNDAIELRGGLVKGGISKKIRYLVVGNIGSRDWKHSSFGRKIEQAIELRSLGHPLCLVPEHHWRASLA